MNYSTKIGLSALATVGVISIGTLKEGPATKDESTEVAVNRAASVMTLVPDVMGETPMVASDPAPVGVATENTRTLLEETETPLVEATSAEPLNADDLFFMVSLEDEATGVQPDTHTDEADHAAVETPATVTPCVAELQMMASRARIYFGRGSSSLNSSARDHALLVAQMAEDCPEAQVKVLGFSDPTGTEEANISMSWKRANNVIALIGANGFDTHRFSALSHQEVHGPECTHFDIVDRRVEFEVVEAAGP